MQYNDFEKINRLYCLYCGFCYLGVIDANQELKIILFCLQ